MAASVGELIRTSRERHGLSQRRLALRAGASQAWISRVESGAVSPSVESVERLLLVMGERLDLATAPLEGDEPDAIRLAEHAALTPAERLERGFAFARFASQLDGRARG